MVVFDKETHKGNQISYMIFFSLKLKDMDITLKKNYIQYYYYNYKGGPWFSEGLYVI